MKAAIIGCGRVAGGYDDRTGAGEVWTHAKAYRADDRVRLAGAWDPDPAQLERFCGRWDVPPARDLGELLESVAPDVVSICSPDDTHSAILKGLPLGSIKGVICEKPLALRHAEAAELAALCQARNVVLAVNYLRRWDGALRDLGRDIQAGRFGGCQAARVLYTKGVFRNASHAINLLLAWFGPCTGAQAVRLRSEPADEVIGSFVLEFAGCPEAIFHAVDTSRYDVFEIELLFEQARVRLPGGGLSIFIERAEASPLDPGARRLAFEAQPLASTLQRAMSAMVRNTVDAVIDGVPLLMPPADAVETVAVCERVRRMVR